jgi:hypothetical protein
MRKISDSGNRKLFFELVIAVSFTIFLGVFMGGGWVLIGILIIALLVARSGQSRASK